MHTISRRKIADYVAEKLYAGDAPKRLAQQLAAYLIEEKQPHHVDLLISDIETALNTRYGISTARITTARPLTAELRTSLTEFVRKSDAAKQVIIAEETVDADLIGGATVSTPSGFFDGSVRYQLQQLRTKGE